MTGVVAAEAVDTTPPRSTKYTAERRNFSINLQSLIINSFFCTSAMKCCNLYFTPCDKLEPGTFRERVCHARVVDQEGMFGDPDVLPGDTLKGIADDLVGPVKEGSVAAEAGSDVVMADREGGVDPSRPGTGAGRVGRASCWSGRIAKGIVCPS